VFFTADPSMLELVLAMGLSVRGIVRKRRRVYIVDNTRIHLDEVEGLGRFVELEVMLQEGEADAAGHARLHHWMARLGIDQRDLLDAAYVDLILKCGDPA
jgi:predicted adenylyl cyclase CyaB